MIGGTDQKEEAPQSQTTAEKSSAAAIDSPRRSGWDAFNYAEK